MTNKEELMILEAIKNYKYGKVPEYKKILVYFPDDNIRIDDEFIDNLKKTAFPHEDVEYCTNISYQEWEKIAYDLEIRESFAYLKYLRNTTI